MPFHAFLSVWLGTITGHQAIIQSWKEVLIVILASLTAVLVWREPKRLAALRQPWVLAGAAFAAIALLVTIGALVTHGLSLTVAIFGIKTDLEFILAAIIATLVSTPAFAKRAVGATILAGLAVTAFALAQSYLLPPDFLAHFGYGPTTILPYLHLSATSDTPRFGGTLGGPNQLGAYFIIVASFTFTISLAMRWWRMLLALPAIIMASFHTYSRSAWIGLVVALAIIGIGAAARRIRIIVALGVVAIILAGTGLTMALISSHPALQQSILHASAATHDDTMSSDSLHAASLSDAVRAIDHAPLGHGLGSAGPATFRTSSPNIIENQFLQISYETGWLGIIAFLATLGLLIRQLLRAKGIFRLASLAAAASLIGISVAGFFIPTFADSTTALVSWTMAGILASLTGAKTTQTEQPSRV
jgi:O-antigen ligase